MIIVRIMISTLSLYYLGFETDNHQFKFSCQDNYLYGHQVLLACELGKPLFLHERDAHPEMVNILERWMVDHTHCTTVTIWRGSAL